MYIHAGKPGLALTMYTEKSMWKEATRVATRHLPHKITEVNMAHQKSLASSNGSQTKEDLLQGGAMWENSKQYSKAIDAYLQVDETKFSVRF